MINNTHPLHPRLSIIGSRSISDQRSNGMLNNIRPLPFMLSIIGSRDIN